MQGLGLVAVQPVDPDAREYFLDVGGVQTPGVCIARLPGRHLVHEHDLIVVLGILSDLTQEGCYVHGRASAFRK